MGMGFRAYSCGHDGGGSVRLLRRNETPSPRTDKFLYPQIKSS